MSVTNTSSKTIYVGTGLVATYSFAWNIWAETDIVLTKVDTDGTETSLTLNSDYTVSLSHSAPTPGTITLTAGNLATGVQLVIQRILPLTQQINISDYSPTPADTWNEGYDRAVMLIQQLQEQLSRVIIQAVNVVTAVTFPSPSANKVIGWDPTGTELINLTSNDSAYLTKASQAVAEAATDDNAYMTALKVKQEVQKSGAVAIPAANVVGIATLTKASTAEAQAGTEDTHYMTPAKTKDAITAQVQNPIYVTGISVPGSSLTVGNTYQAASDGFVFINVALTTTGGSLNFYSDSSNTPTTLVAQLEGYYSSLTFPIKKNQYYKLSIASGTISTLQSYCFISLT